MLMVQDSLSNEEEVELLDQRVHVLTTTKYIRHSIRNLVKLTGN